MKAIWIGTLILGALLAGASPLRAQEGLGLGVILGEPTGVTAKTWLTRDTAFVLAAAWSFTDEEGMDLHGDYLIHNYNTFPTASGNLPFTYGLGARVKLGGNDPVVGLRVPVGLSYLFQSTPWELFLELVPILDVTPDTEIGLGAAVGARYTLR